MPPPRLFELLKSAVTGLTSYGRLMPKLVSLLSGPPELRGPQKER